MGEREEMGRTGDEKEREMVGEKEKKEWFGKCMYVFMMACASKSVLRPIMVIKYFVSLTFPL